MLLCLGVAGIGADAARAQARDPATTLRSSSGADASTAATVAQTSVGTTNRLTDSITLEQIDARIRELEGTLNAEDSNQTQILDLYRNARARVEARLDHQKASAEYQRLIQSGPDELAQIEKMLAAPPQPAAALVPDAPSIEMEQVLIEARSALANARANLADADKTLLELKDRPTTAAREAAEARATITQISSESGTEPNGMPENLQTARSVFATARKEARTAQLIRIEQELLSLDIRTRLAQAQRALALRESTRLAERAAALEQQLTQRRATEAQSALERAEATQREVAGKHPMLVALAAQNAALSQTLATQLKQMESFRQQLLALKAKAEEIERSFKTARQRVELSRLSDKLGQVLREQRNRLPDVRRYRINAVERSELLGTINLNQLEIDEERQTLVDKDERTARLLTEAGLGEAPQLRSEVMSLLTERAPVLDQLSRAYSDQARLLTEMDAEQRQLVEFAVEYGEFLDRNLIWTPSVRPLGMEIVYEQPAAWAFLLSFELWAQVADDLQRQLRQHPFSAGLGILITGVLFWFRRRSGARLRALTVKMRRIRDDSFGHTTSALLITLMRPLPWFLLLGGTGRLLASSTETNSFSSALGVGLINGAWLCLGALSIRAVMRSSGLGEAHFGWNVDRMRYARRVIDWWTLVSVPAMVLATAFDIYSNIAHRESIGRSMFVIGVLALSVLAWRLLHPHKGLAAGLLAAYPEGWLSRLRPLWYPAAIAIPLVLALLAAMGYLYTARQLELRLITTIAMFAGLVVLRYMVFRWLLVTRRKHAFARARERWESRRQQPGDTDGEAAVIEEPRIDIEEVGAQTRHLINTTLNIGMLFGLWMVWSAVIPALSVLNEIELWRHATSVDGQLQSVPVTLQGMLVMLFVIFITAAAARNLPGALEIAVLQRLPLDFGSRYAISTIVQYIIGAIGIVYAFSTVGIAWADVQWLVAALSVGLGFGLQEIFANFVSGLIILFERPIRVGDVVTVGGLDGTVSRIRIRATTITNFDNKETVVPNKTFITTQVTNWTLTNSITRLVIPVGVAYGSDIKTVNDCISEVLNRHPMVLSEPPPRVWFRALGDSSLNFEVHVRVQALADRFPVIHELLTEIVAQLESHGIEIPFPQRDLHIKWPDYEAHLSNQPPSARVTSQEAS